MQGASTKSVESANPASAPNGATKQSPFANVPIPATADELQAIIATRDQLSSQLSNVRARHNELVNYLKDAPAEARAGMTEQLKVLTDRMVAIETELATTGWQVAHAPRELLSKQSFPSTPPPEPGLGSGQFTAISIVAIIFIGFPIALAFSRVLWRRATGRMSLHKDIETAPQLRRMEHAVDAMAIEIERISEGQRFLTQLFAKEQRPQVLAQNADAANDTPSGNLREM